MTTPISCFGTGFVNFDGLLFSYGGGKKGSNVAHIYGGYGLVMSTMTVKASPITHHASCGFDDLYVAHGGCRDSRHLKRTLVSADKLLFINPNTLAVTKRRLTGEVPSPRALHQVLVVRRNLLLIAGGLSSGPLADCYCVDLTTMESTWCGNLPLPLFSFAMVSCKDRIFLLGGQTEGMVISPGFYELFLSDVTVSEEESIYHTFCCTTTEPQRKSQSVPKYRLLWRKLPHTPFLPRRGISCTTICTQIVIFGGTSGTAYYNDLWIYSIENEYWKEYQIYQDVPGKRFSAAIGHIMTNLVVAGGSNGLTEFHDSYLIDATLIALDAEHT